MRIEYPKISLVIPSFKAGSTIERTLNSIKLQNYPNLQLIVMDGGSKDETVDILVHWNEFIDFWVSEPDKGQVDALNKGFANANGEILGWVCADDELILGALKSVAETFLDHPKSDVVTGGCRRVFADGKHIDTLPSPSFYEDLSFKNTIEQPSTFWRSYVAERIGELDGNYKYAFDWEYWCRMKERGVKFHSIPTPLSIYHFSDENLTSTGGRAIADEMYRIIKHYGPYNGKVADVYRLLYRYFDLKGYYDAESTNNLPGWKLSLFHFVLRILYMRYDPHVINSYNWNFVSRQERGLGW